MKFKLLHGVHYENGMMHEPGDVVDSDKNLMALFVNRFERISEEEAEKSPTGRPVVEKGPVGDLGEDVTEEFPIATNMGLRVFHSGREYRVVDENDESLHEHPIFSKIDVKNLLKQMTNANA